MVWLLTLAFVLQQIPKGTFATDPCGDPTTVSQIYTSCDAVVKDVLDGRTVVVDFLRPCAVEARSLREVKGRQTLRLVQLDTPPPASPIGKESRMALAGRVLGRRVEVTPSPFQHRGDLIAMLYGPGGDQSVRQLEAGLASYRNYGPYAVDWYKACVYKRAQESARLQALGIWAQK